MGESRKGGAALGVARVRRGPGPLAVEGQVEPLDLAVGDRWAAWAQRRRIPGFVALVRTIRERRDGILAAVRLGLSNGRVEGLNNSVRFITRRGFGFHSAAAVAALVMLSCGPITLTLPHEK